MGNVCSCGENAEGKKGKKKPSNSSKPIESKADPVSDSTKELTEVIKQLKQVPLLKNFKDPEFKKIAAKLQKKDFDDGDDLMIQGEFGKEFFLITEGKCDVIVEDAVVATLESGDYCGEQALLSDDKEGAKRNATIRSKGVTSCLVIERKDFKDLIGTSNKVMFAKRDNKRVAVATQNLDDFEIDATKSYAEGDVLGWLLDIVNVNDLFKNMSSEQQLVVVKHMYSEECKQGEPLITEGEDGEKFYVIDSGKFEVSSKDSGKIVDIGKGEVTGDLALLYNAPRSATVTCLETGSVWVLERNTLRKALMMHSKEQTTKYIGFLRKVDLLSPLLASEIALIDQALEEQEVEKGHVFMKQGDAGDKFYIILEGVCEVNVKKEEDDDEVRDLNAGDFFGEKALINDAPRAATITAKEKTKVLWLSREDFKNLLGPLTDIMERNIDEYEKPIDERHLIGQKPDDDETFCDLNEFTTIGVLGKGAFGTVTLVVDPNTEKSYALKAIRKLQIVELGQQSHIVNEKKVMGMLASKFLVNLRSTYKDKWRVYFLLDVCLGGELFTVLRRMRSFDEKTGRFYAACVIEAFDYMHSLNVIYRDLKPENLVLADDGYLKVTDFGFAKVVVNKTFTLCGTPDYLAPEIVTGQGHGKGVDWWTLGVLIYEMLASFPPFFDDEPMMTYRKIISCKFKFPKFLSPRAKDIITRLLKPRPTKRYGVMKGGARLLREHHWYNDEKNNKKFDWEQLRTGEMPPPMKPSVASPDDISNFEKFKAEEEPFEFDSSKMDMSWDEEF